MRNWLVNYNLEKPKPAFMKTRVRKIADINNQYRFDFEAPVVQTSLPARRNYSPSELPGTIDLNIYLAPNPENVYLVQVTGESMIDENIFEGDFLVVDKTEVPKDGKIVIASLNGELAVKTYREIEGTVYLFSANSKFNPIKIEPFYEFQIQGIVKHVIHVME